MVIRVAIVASIIALFVIVYALIECSRTRPQDVRSISKPAWILSILLLPLVGAVLWFFLGRPRASDRSASTYGAPGSASRSTAPDDDAAFLRRLEQERQLKAREAELKRLEDELKRRKGDDGTEPNGGPEVQGPGGGSRS